MTLSSNVATYAKEKNIKDTNVVLQIDLSLVCFKFVFKEETIVLSCCSPQKKKGKVPNKHTSLLS